MANRIKQEFELNVSQSEKNIQKLIQDTEKFEKGIEKLGNSKGFSKLGISAEQLQKDIKGNAQAFEQFANDMSKNTNTVKSQIRQLQNAMMNLSANGIDQASESYRAMQAELGRLKDIQGDVAAAGNVWANDYAQMQGVIQGVGALAAGYGALQSTMQILGVENENVNEAMKTTMAVTSLLNSVQTIQQAFNKDSVLMLTIIKPLREAYNAAIARGTAAQTANNTATIASAGAMTSTKVATIAATAAQKAFNLVAKANPYVLLATAISAAAAAVYTLTKNSNEAAIAERNLQKETEETKKRIEEQRATMANASMTYGESAAKLQLLYRAYQKTNSELQRTEIIKQAQAEFNKMGIAIKGVKDAENLLIRSTPKMIKALQLQGQAAALSAMAMEAYKKSFNMLLENGYDVGTAHILAGANKQYQELMKLSLSLKAEGDSYLKGLGGSGGGSRSSSGGSRSSSGGGSHSSSGKGGTTSTKPSYDDGTVAALEAKISDINKKLKEKKLTEEESIRLNKELLKLEEDKAKAIAEQERSRNIAEYTTKIAEIDKKVEEEKLTQEEINKLYLERLGYIEKLDKLQNPNKSESKPNVSGLSLQGVDYTYGIEKPKPIKIEVDTTDIDSAKEKLNNLLGGDIISKAEEFGQLWNVADGMGKTALAMGAMSDITTTMADGFSQAARNSEEWAVAAKAAEVASRSFAAAEAAIAAVEAIKSAAQMPFPENIVGIATASASVLAALFNVMGAFESGGIVGGQDYHGDKRTIRVNSGEMILNGRQQANLFNMINSGGKSSVGGQVEFKIKGRELVGVLNNFNNKTSKVL